MVSFLDIALLWLGAIRHTEAQPSTYLLSPALFERTASQGLPAISLTTTLCPTYADWPKIWGYSMGVGGYSC
jgi:hypothetical protein